MSPTSHTVLWFCVFYCSSRASTIKASPQQILDAKQSCAFLTWVPQARTPFYTFFVVANLHTHNCSHPSKDFESQKRRARHISGSHDLVHCAPFCALWFSLHPGTPTIEANPQRRTHYYVSLNHNAVNPQQLWAQNKVARFSHGKFHDLQHILALTFWMPNKVARFSRAYGLRLCVFVVFSRSTNRGKLSTDLDVIKAIHFSQDRYNDLWHLFVLLCFVATSRRINHGVLLTNFGNQAK